MVGYWEFAFMVIWRCPREEDSKLILDKDAKWPKTFKVTTFGWRQILVPRLRFKSSPLDELRSQKTPTDA